MGEGCQGSEEFGEVREKDIKLACDERRGVGESEMGDADDHRYRPRLWVPKHGLTQHSVQCSEREREKVKGSDNRKGVLVGFDSFG